MGFRGGLKKGGGFWNNTDGVLLGFEFTNTAPGADAAGDWVYVVPSFQADGAEDVTTQHLFLGGADRYSISKDGKTAQGVVDGENAEITTIGANTPAGRFFDTLVEKGEELGIENLLPDLEGGDPLNFEAIEGTRVRLIQEKDEVGTKKRGQRQGQNGQKYDRTNTVIASVYSLPGGKRAAKESAKLAKGDTSIRDKADKVVVDLIAAAVDKKTNKTGETPVSKFKMAALRALGKDKDKDAVIKMIGDEGYRADAAERGVFAYDAEAETVSIEA